MASLYSIHVGDCNGRLLAMLNFCSLATHVFPDVDASSDYSGASVTVEDVPRKIQEDLRKPSSKRELYTLPRGDQTAIRDAFNKRCKTKEDLSKGLYRIDYLRGRDRLQILPRHPLDGVHRFALYNTSAVKSSRQYGIIWSVYV
jgi:hypothetical protein